ncbi:hypothetical protein [uncultured Dokdonia sp.]|uniref:hypothetical protein n=1 Tax=Dokdonia sp. R78006 TaxID=3093866 RepID=UPI002617CF0F|nr:hypothetical protein [uncultured Dokdonia sp.]
MHKSDLNRVVFYSKEDMASGHQLRKGELILRAEIKSEYNDVNEILELYNIKKYIDIELFLNDWTSEDILVFKNKATEFGKIIGRFMSQINDINIIDLYNKTLRNYINSFWELVNNQNVFKRISEENFQKLLLYESHLIHIILNHKNIVERYNATIRDFLLTYPQSAEILLSIYEVKDDLKKKQKTLPKSLTAIDKEAIILNYLNSNVTNLNYVELIQNFRNKNDFKILDKTRLKAKRLLKKETDKLFANKQGLNYGVKISFPENLNKIKDGFVDDNLIANYSYSLDFIKQNRATYQLFLNFKYLFEYLDNQNRINLVSKRSEMGALERIMGVHSQNEYRSGTSFSLSEVTSHSQIYTYSQVLKNLSNSLENILHLTFTNVFQKKYSFADNARFSIPTATSYFEKVRLLAPEFESALKQFKLYVEDGIIDFELLQISSSPSTIKDIPSLNSKKYIYLNETSEVMVGCSNIFFSDQTLLAYVEPFKEDKYSNFFDLLANEEVKFTSYEEYQKPRLNYLIKNGFIRVNKNNFIQMVNPARVLILKDLYENDVGSYYNYPIDFQREAQRMDSEDIINFENSLFSKTEQDYFNYFLNKSQFTNGLDLRNSYLHGTQADPNEIEKHEYAYFTYLKLIFLAFLKIDDDLSIYRATKKQNAEG